MAKKRKRTTVKQRETKKRKKVKHSATQSETAMQTVDAEVLPSEENQSGFYTSVKTRVEVIALHYLQIPVVKIAERTGISPTTVTKIIRESPEREAITQAMQTAGIIELVKTIPEAVESLRNQIKSGDGGLALAMLRGLQLLNPRAEIVANAKGGEFDDWTVAELTKFLADGEKPSGK